jgi:hypothetical protein
MWSGNSPTQMGGPSTAGFIFHDLWISRGRRPSLSKTEMRHIRLDAGYPAHKKNYSLREDVRKMQTVICSFSTLEIFAGDRDLDRQIHSVAKLIFIS